MTLAFLGEVAPEAVAAALAVRLRRAPLAIRLDRVGSFRRARVAWAGSSEPNRELQGLRAALAAQLRRRGFVLEERPFAAHVTLVRSARRAVPPAAIPPIGWTAAQVHLVRSDLATGRYENVKAWRLGAGG